MSDLPSGWEWSTLGEIGSYINGRGFKKSEWSTRGRPIIRIQNLTGFGKDFNYFDGPLEDRYVVEPGDLLISWAATLGAFIWQGPQGALNQHIFKVDSAIDLRFHYYLINFLLRRLYQETQGSGMVHITRGRFDSLPVALPPLAEQRRIAEEISLQLSRLESGQISITRTRRRLRQLVHIVTKHDLRGSDDVPIQSEPSKADVQDGDLPKLPSSWHWARLHEIADVVSGVTKDSAKQSDPTIPAVPYLRVANVQRGYLNLADVAEIRAPREKVERLRLLPGDVLLNEGGDRDKLGRGWVWEGQIDHCIHQNHVFRARIRDCALHPKLLAWHANSFGHWFEANGKQSVNLASISLRTIKQLPVPIPPVEKQEELVGRIEDQLEEISRLQEAISSAADRITTLRTAILTDAFAGRIAPQDPDDEPASVLLDRIRAERSSAHAHPRRRRAATST